MKKNPTAPKDAEKHAGTGLYVPCPGNFAKVPKHAGPVWLEWFRARTGSSLWTKCTFCGLNIFVRLGFDHNYYTAAEVLRDGPRMMSHLPNAFPLNGFGNQITA